MKNENYILLKDTFDLKAGAVFEYCNPVNEAYYTNGSYFLHYSKVENNPDWFMKESDYKFNNEFLQKKVEAQIWWEKQLEYIKLKNMLADNKTIIQPFKTKEEEIAFLKGQINILKEQLNKGA